MGAIVIGCLVAGSIGACSSDAAAPKKSTLVDDLPSDLASCAKSASTGVILPTHLVFILDRSKSMGFSDAAPICDSNTPCVEGKCAQGPTESFGRCADLLDRKWNAAKDALYTFLSDPGSAGSFASLDTFAKAPLDESVNGPSCLKESYFAEGSVAHVTLPDAQPFRDALDPLDPLGFTPTYPAVYAAADFAFTKTPAGERPVVVLVTDGAPNQCSDTNTPSGIATLAKSYLERGVNTFVVGVDMGSSTISQFDYVASSGGSTSVIPIVVGKAEETKENLLSGLGRVKDGACSLAIPAPPEGESLDYDLVNVALGKDTLTYSKECKGAGWRYDNPSSPSRIDLCPSSCTASRKSKSALSVAFGCETKGGVIL